MSKPVELYKGNASGRCSADVYRNGERLTDLRTLIDFDKLKARLGLRSEQNYADEKVTALQRLARYKGCNDGFDLDCCKKSAKYYHFQPVQDMYEVLWPVDEYPRDIVDSAETLVSANAALKRCKTENQSYIKRGKIDWDSLRVEASELEYDDEINDLNDFAHAVATIGNFMPVPGEHQSLLSQLGERYDKVLKQFKQYYACTQNREISVMTKGGGRSAAFRRFRNGSSASMGGTDSSTRTTSRALLSTMAIKSWRLTTRFTSSPRCLRTGHE